MGEEARSPVRGDRAMKVIQAPVGEPVPVKRPVERTILLSGLNASSVPEPSSRSNLVPKPLPPTPLSEKDEGKFCTQTLP